MDCAEIVPISNGYTLVDEDCAGSLVAAFWRINKDGYVQDGDNKLLHRILTGAAVGMVVDHINGEPLDNRRSNLRVCTQQQNLWNGRAHRDGTSRYRGVCLRKSDGRWRVQIQGKQLGVFDNEDEAGLAYNAAALERFGRFARLNVVQGAGVEPARA